MTLFHRKDNHDRNKVYMLNSFVASYKRSACNFNISNLSIKWLDMDYEKDLY